MSQRISRLFVVIAVPLHLQSWIPTPISRQLPVVSESGQEWSISTKNTAGGFAYLFTDNGPPSDARLSWEWKVGHFPLSRIELPIIKNKDDFALRVGILINDGTSMTVPPCLKVAASKSKLPVSHIVFYLAVPSDAPEGCVPSPFTDQIIYCPKHALDDFTRLSVNPMRDLNKFSKVNESKEKIIGLWIFADSDDTHSSSKAAIKSLEFTEEKK